MINAAFIDGDALICAIPSESKSGLYFIAVCPERDYLSVTHSGLTSMENQMPHIKEAAACYHVWQWWEQCKKVIVKYAPIILQPHWIQIPVPGTINDITQQIGAGEWYAAEYFGYCN